MDALDQGGVRAAGIVAVDFGVSLQDCSLSAIPMPLRASIGRGDDFSDCLSVVSLRRARSCAIPVTGSGLPGEAAAR